jgi:hypothetical protein
MPFKHHLNVPIVTSGIGYPWYPRPCPQREHPPGPVLKGAKHILRILKDFGRNLINGSRHNGEAGTTRQSGEHMFSAIRRDLGLQLLGLYLLFVGPVVVGSLYFDYYTSQRLQADVKASDLALARAIAEETNTVIDGALQAVRQLGTYPSVIDSDPEGWKGCFKSS